jgi:protein-disulfide isomerase
MGSKKRKTAARRGGRTARGRQKRSFLQRYGLLVGVIVVAMLGVTALAVVDRAGAGQNSGPDVRSLNKSLGEAGAPVVVAVYSDFQCPYCKLFADDAGEQLREEYIESGQVRLAYRHFAFLGEESLWAAEASDCADEQGRFWDYHDQLFVVQGAENGGVFAKDNLKSYAAEIGLDTDQFNECFDSGEYRSRVRQEYAEGQRLGVRGTPTVFVDGRLVRNGSDYQVLRAAIETALAGRQ